MKRTLSVVFALAMLACAGTVKAEEAKSGEFWKSEAERSGFSQLGSNIGSFFRNFGGDSQNFFQKQRERYEARKAQAGA
ncbi:MAG: hypothetical protein MOGMAGMI_00055 [Candidatus Omnitrophica bacterium]|nr:hypothetical protein [Candidatus Omnitrophota bacterium]